MYRCDYIYKTLEYGRRVIIGNSISGGKILLEITDCTEAPEESLIPP